MSVFAGLTDGSLGLAISGGEENSWESCTRSVQCRGLLITCPSCGGVSGANVTVFSMLCR